MNEVFKDYLGKFVLVYLDDILVYSKNEEEHKEHLRIVLRLLREHRLYGRLAKSDFGKIEMPFLGHVVSADGISVDPAKTAVIQTWEIPTSLRDVQSFLGFANWFRMYIPGYSQRVTPLTRLTRKNVHSQWTPECQACFDWLKRCLQNPPVLALANFAQQFEVRADASSTGVGAVLMQGGRPLAYESASFSPAERNYTIGEQELLAVVFALRKWRTYLEGNPHPVRIVTDHMPLTYLPTKGTLGPRQVRWSEYLSRFHLEWVHTAGKDNVADALSRLPCLAAFVITRSRTQSQSQSEAKLPTAPVPIADSQPSPAPMEAEPLVQSSQQPDIQTSKIGQEDFLAQVRAGYTTDAWLENKANRRQLSQSVVLWWRKGTLYIPDIPALKEECLSHVHDHPYAGHVGMDRTADLLTRLYWWPGCQQSAQEYVRTCGACQRNKPLNVKKAGLLQPMPIPGRPWASVGIDFITHLPMTKNGHNAIFVAVDRCTKMVHLMPTTDKVTAAGTARLFIDNVVKLHGVPEDFVSDRDPRFMGKFWQAFCQSQGIDKSMSSAFHPETDGQTERVNRILVEMLRNYVDPTQDDWDEHLTAAEFAINNAYQKSIKTTPFMLNYGQNPLTPASLRIPRVQNPEALTLTGTLQERLARAKKYLEAAQSRQKAYADKGRRPQEFNVGDEVLLSTSNISFKGVGAPKLMPRYIGPYKVVKRIGATSYELELAANMRIHDVFHVSLLKPYVPGRGIHPPPPQLTSDGTVEFEVDRILKHEDRRYRGKGLTPHLSIYKEP
ncbi:Transposon Tf2-9 polyprotein [Coccomyxa sp. Obi]|nr:Transposon Tf2-9 polyprotein [Coccomyxa sp. Obi]